MEDFDRSQNIAAPSDLHKIMQKRVGAVMQKRLVLNRLESIKTTLLNSFIKENTVGVCLDKRTPRCIVSLTSYPARMKDIHFCLMSLLNQTVKPDEVVLWLGEEQFPNKEKDIPEIVLNLQKNGLIIKWTKDIKSYKKLIPALKQFPNDIIVTADDDIIYKEDWFEKLYREYQNFGGIVCHRAHKVKLADNGFTPYSMWDKCITDESCSFFNFATTGGGALYPPHCFYKDVLNEDLFTKLAATADDIWFWVMAVLNGCKIRVMKNPHNSCCFLYPYHNEGEALYDLNIVENDKQLYQVLEQYPQLLNQLRREELELQSA